MGLCGRVFAYCLLKFISLPVVVRHYKGCGQHEKTFAEGQKVVTEAHHLAQACDGRSRM
ncbi:hypothetical protein JCM19039_2193 [Geomicrobium sp. JCM 19039]|nr:hypothetical protein JCM19039_2193 [Geomicrobium sp. JCM 19039]